MTAVTPRVKRRREGEAGLGVWRCGSGWRFAGLRERANTRARGPSTPRRSWAVCRIDPAARR